MKLPKPFCNHDGSQPTTDEDRSEDVVEKQSWSLQTSPTLKPSLPWAFGPTAVIGPWTSSYWISVFVLQLAAQSTLSGM